jgi:hypothetical protein
LAPVPCPPPPGAGVGVGVGGTGVGVGGTGVPLPGTFHPAVCSHCSIVFHHGVEPDHDGRPGSVAAPAAVGHTTAAAMSVTHAILTRRLHAGIPR